MRASRPTWTMKHRPAVAFLEAANAWKIVDDARGNEEIPRPFFAAVRELEAVVIVDRRRAGHADASELDAVLWQLPPSEIEELPRRSAVTREVAVQRARGAIARLTDIANQDAATAAAEDRI